MPLDPTLATIRLTPDDLLPAVGEEYRSRKTGAFVTLVEWLPVSRLVVLSEQRMNKQRRFTLNYDLFIDHYIHAKVWQ